MRENIKKLTLQQVIDINTNANKTKSVDEWKTLLKEYAKEYNLTDQEVIYIATSKLFGELIK